MKLTKIAVAMGLAIGAASAFADDVKNPNTPTPQRSQEAGGAGLGSSALDTTAGAFWTENSRNGQLTKEQAMKYKDKQGKTPDMTKLDADKDNKISKAEWTKYHTVTVTQVAPGVVVVDLDTFWVKNAKSGYLTRDQAMKYNGPEGTAMNFERLDADKDGRVSQPEWTKYHTSNPLKSDGARDAGYDDRQSPRGSGSGR